MKIYLAQMGGVHVSYTMTAGNKRNRHSRLGCLLQNCHLLVRRIPTAALNARKHFYSINTIRHSRMPRLTPGSYFRRLCPVQMGAAPYRKLAGKPRQARAWLNKVVSRQPRLFVHWLAHGKVAVRAMGAV
jgi:hypothetical protein